MRLTKGTLLLLVTTLVVLSIIYYFGYGIYLGSSSVFLELKSHNKEQISLQGDIVNSAKAFTGYSYKVLDDELIVRVRAALVTPIRRSGQVTIQINDSLENIKRITLVGKHEEDKKIIWEDR